MLRRLKAETADLHTEAEVHVRILDVDASVADYANYLRAMAGFHAPLEAQFATNHALLATGFDPAARRKAHLAVADLSVLGDVGEVPSAPVTSDGTDLYTALGMAYVIEGSTLGGRFIQSRLPPALTAYRGRATAFLEGYGEATGLRWKQFSVIVERTVTTPAHEAATLAGARATFSAMIAWLALHDGPSTRRATPSEPA